MKYLTIEIQPEEGGGYTVLTRQSRRHWDEPCPCGEEGFAGEDVHDDITQTMHVQEIRLSAPQQLTGSTDPET